MNGVIVVNKPQDWTSHDAVNRMRRLANTKRVGHLGTLDPMATGVLPLVIGSATRLAQFFTRADKIYDAVIRFGYATSTYDRQGTPVEPLTEPEIDPQELQNALMCYRGTFDQVPPPVSAKKVGGTPAYKLARKNIPVELKPVEVTVYQLNLLDCQGAEAHLYVHCSSGTYLRSIAHELGQKLGCGAHLKELQRLAVGEFEIEQSRTLEQLGTLAQEGRLSEALIPAAKLLPDIPAETVDSITATQIRNGRDFRVSPFRVRQGTRYVKAVTQDGELLAIGEAVLPNLYHPVLVM